MAGKPIIRASSSGCAAAADRSTLDHRSSGPRRAYVEFAETNWQLKAAQFQSGKIGKRVLTGQIRN